MYTVFVKYALPNPVPRSAILEGFKSVEERFRNTPKLIRKYFCYDEASHTGYSFYLWEDEASARGFFNDDMKADFKQKFGTEPELECVDLLMAIDNDLGKTDFYE